MSEELDGGWGAVNNFSIMSPPQPFHPVLSSQEPTFLPRGRLSTPLPAPLLQSQEVWIWLDNLTS